MKILIFQAATSLVAIAAMTRFADEVRADGHSVGLRQLQGFRREKEPADLVVIALSPAEAGQYKNYGLELIQTFGDIDKIIPIELPEDEADFEDFDFADKLSDKLEVTTDVMSLDQLKAEAIERGLEVTPTTTAAELAHALDIDYHPGSQEGDRLTDRRNMNSTPEDRVGLRTSTVLPTVNGLDLERMNDEQLRATAAQVGLKVPARVSRVDLINKITAMYANKVQAPADSSPKAPAQSFDTDLVNLNEAELKELATREDIDVGRSTSVEGLTAKIVEGRKAKAKADGNDG